MQWVIETLATLAKGQEISHAQMILSMVRLTLEQV
jgi:hypothetical protein